MDTPVDTPVDTPILAQLKSVESALEALHLAIGQGKVTEETLGADGARIKGRLKRVELLAAGALRMLGGYTPKLTVKVMAMGDPPIDPVDPDTMPSE